MDICITDITKVYPCRQDLIKELYSYYGNDNEILPSALFVYGNQSTGKTSIINYFFQYLNYKFVLINSIECYTLKIFYELILNELKKYEYNKEHNDDNVKCDNMQDFVYELIKLNRDYNYVIVIDNAEKLRDMEFNILPCFIRLSELTGLNLSSMFISKLPFEKFLPKTGIPDIEILYIKPYTKKNIEEILMLSYPNYKNTVANYIKQQSNNLTENEKETKLKHLSNLKDDFFENYLNVFLNIFYRCCCDLNELKFISNDCFKKYCEPVLDGSINENDVANLWRFISKPMKIALNNLYTRVDNSVNFVVDDDVKTMKKLAQTLELPYYAKYLLIASFLASHNSVKDDKRLFMKNHGKQRKRLQTVKAKLKTTDKMNIQLGPKIFTIDRLLAIFYAILDEKVGLTCNLLASISSLVHLKFLCFASGENNIMDGGARLQCTVGLDFILHIGRIVGFNVRQYLTDLL